MKTLHLFEAVGIEIEYAIVDSNSLQVKPCCNELFHDVASEYVEDIENGAIAWSNELVNHLVELKTNGPTNDFASLPELFLSNLQTIDGILNRRGATLLSTGCHPSMKPELETMLWPQGNDEVYQAFNRIFNCRGHGWANLQSAHLNLPWADETEFVKLHQAIRLLLPIIPAIAASTPIIEDKITGIADTRLHFYQQNQLKIPSIMGHVVPEIITSIADYHQTILATMYRDIAVYDPDQLLQSEWLNSRGAIARFDRKAIEIRLIDTQETPVADIAIAWLITHTLKLLVEKDVWNSFSRGALMNTRALAAILQQSIIKGDDSNISDSDYLSLFGIHNTPSMNSLILWQSLFEVTDAHYHCPEAFQKPLRTIFELGNLSSRILQALPATPNHEDIMQVYRKLNHCLLSGKLFA